MRRALCCKRVPSVAHQADGLSGLVCVVVACSVALSARLAGRELEGVLVLVFALLVGAAAFVEGFCCRAWSPARVQLHPSAWPCGAACLAA